MTSPIARAGPRLAVAAAAAAVGLAILALMLWNAELLVRLGLVGHLWYVLLLLLGLAAAVCLFALFRSYARYTGKVLNGSLELGGPAVVMLIVLGLGFYFVPGPRERFDLTVFVHGEAGRQALVLRNRGNLSLDLGRDRRSEAIGDKGEVRFVGIPADQRGLTVPVTLEADDYELVKGDAGIKLDVEAAYVAVRAKMLPLSGEVFDAGSRPLAGARLRIADQTAVTDADGRFRLRLPADLPESERVMTITAPGHVPWRGQVAPGGNPLVVQLKSAP
jgi:hypothetical protein